MDLLAETGVLDCKPAESPIVTNHGLQIIEGAKMTDKDQYWRMVGKLFYLSHTRLDIAYTVSIVSRFMHLPQVQHMETVMRIIRHFKGTSGRGILLGRNNNLNLIAYTIVDWEGEKDG